MRRLSVTAAVLAATLATVALPAAASADEWRGGGYGWHGGRGWDRDRDWRRDEWREHRRYGYGYGYGYGGYYARPYAYVRPPVVVYGNPYGY